MLNLFQTKEQRDYLLMCRAQYIQYGLEIVGQHFLDGAVYGSPDGFQYSIYDSDLEATEQAYSVIAMACVWSILLEHIGLPSRKMDTATHTNVNFLEADLIHQQHIFMVDESLEPVNIPITRAELCASILARNTYTKLWTPVTITVPYPHDRFYAIEVTA